MTHWRLGSVVLKSRRMVGIETLRTVLSKVMITTVMVVTARVTQRARSGRTSSTSTGGSADPDKAQRIGGGFGLDWRTGQYDHHVARVGVALPDRGLDSEPDDLVGGPHLADHQGFDAPAEG